MEAVIRKPSVCRNIPSLEGGEQPFSGRWSASREGSLYLDPTISFFVGGGGLFPARIMVVKIADLIGRPTMSKPVVAVADGLFGLPVSHAVTLTLAVGLSVHGYRNN
jgi:hypothetical protein